MADSIEAIIERRIERSSLDDDVAIYVMAALDGTLAKFIDGGSARENAEQPRPAAAATAPAKASLLRESVAGFRGIGPRADLEVVPGPGLTLVVGANGTGKSSFAEGLEFLLTGENLTLGRQDQEWRQGWRNMHSEESPCYRPISPSRAKPGLPWSRAAGVPRPPSLTITRRYGNGW